MAERKSGVNSNVVFLLKSNASRRSAKNMETELTEVKGAVICLEEKSK